MTTVELQIDVTEQAQVGEPARVAATVCMPDPQALQEPPVVCVLKPGGGYSRRYFTTDLPGPAAGAQADWHTARGWVVVAVDHLGVGDSSVHDMSLTGFVPTAAASHAAEQEVLRRLAKGEVSPELPPLIDPVVLGVGQSMGGALTIVQQAHHRTYDGIAVLGYGVLHSRVATPPGTPAITTAWRLRDAPQFALNARQLEAEANDHGRRDHGALSEWMFFYDDVDLEQVTARGGARPWASATYPGAARSCLTPSIVAPEAAVIDVPVLVAMGQRDVVADPRGEVRAYLSSDSVDLFICPRMGHMHNFAGTRELLWRRLDTWSQWVATNKARR